MCRQSFCWFCGASLHNDLGVNVSTMYKDPIGNNHKIHLRCLQDAEAADRFSDQLPHQKKDVDASIEIYIPSHRWKNEL